LEATISVAQGKALVTAENDPIYGAGHFERDDVLPIDETAEAIAE
jgi:hypothetical protein